MTIPDHLKIGGRVVKIRRCFSVDMNGVSGNYNDWAGIIRISNDADINPEEPKIALIHEIVECLNKRHEYNLEHPIIQGLAENLYQVLKDNRLYFGEDEKDHEPVP